MMLHNIIEIAEHLNNYEKDNLLRSIVVPVKTKFLKYWQNIPMLYCFAFILDPRAKMRGFNSAMQVLSNLISTDYSNYFTNVRAELHNMFAKYDRKFGNLWLNRPIQSLNVNKRKTTWRKIYGSFECGDPSSTSSGSIASNFGPHASELLMYIDSDPITMFDDDFDLLSWWREHKTTYHILYILAKDVLTVPVSTISSEFAFSLTGKIIVERRRSLVSSMVKVLTCLKDWQQGEDRQQHTTENVALEKAYTVLG
jgi:hypothetical protein